MKSKPAGVLYHGHPGSTHSCRRALCAFMLAGDEITRASLVTYDSRHGLIIETIVETTVVISAAFTSGYSGEGPSGLSFALALLYAHDIEVEEYLVDADFMKRMDRCALTMADMRSLEGASPIRPVPTARYIRPEDFKRAREGTLWSDFQQVIPLNIIDPHLADLAIRFEKHPDQMLLSGYRRLEDRLRARTATQNHGIKLITHAFRGTAPALTWPEASEAERQGRINLFVGAFAAHRNHRAHRESVSYGFASASQLSEFLVLNHLFRLEREARASTAVAAA